MGLVAVAAFGGCGGGTAGTGIATQISRDEGYAVTNCHELPSIEEVAREIGDYGAKAYGCSGGLGVVMEPDGQVSDFPAPTQAAATGRLTAADIDARMIDQAKAQYGVTPKKVDCGSSVNVPSGDTLRCAITLPGAKTGTFNAAVSGRPGHFKVVLS